MKPITYSLKVNLNSSDVYYNEAHSFTNEVIEKSNASILPIVNNYMNYLQKYRIELLREKEEYILELLSFGILWEEYSPYALNVHFAPFIMLSQMGEWRKKHQRYKPIIDFTRGMLTTLLLLPKSQKKNSGAFPTLEEVDKVCVWFEATGEFREQALRFIGWRAYWGTLSSQELQNNFYEIKEFASWFINNAEEKLGKYTGNVNSFLESSRDKYKWREDRISCTRSRAEYHLNMVGADLMNRAFKNDFDDTTSTAVLLPGCMRFRDADKCEAQKEARGLKCIGCEPKCRVNHLRVSGQKKNYEVYVIPHASDLSLWAPKDKQNRQGIIASACVTTLVEGGWELKRYGVPAQCVLLDYSGCKKHWHPVGVETTLNKNELEKVLNKNSN